MELEQWKLSLSTKSTTVGQFITKSTRNSVECHYDKIKTIR